MKTTINQAGGHRPSKMTSSSPSNHSNLQSSANDNVTEPRAADTEVSLIKVTLSLLVSRGQLWLGDCVVPSIQLVPLIGFV